MAQDFSELARVRTNRTRLTYLFARMLVSSRCAQNPFQRSPSKRCDERVKIARNTLEGSAIFPLPFLPGEIGRKRIKFGFLDFWIWPGDHVIPSLRTVKTVTPCWLGARPNAHNPRQRGLNPKRKSQGSMLIWMIDEARTKRILCLA